VRRGSVGSCGSLLGPVSLGGLRNTLDCDGAVRCVAAVVGAGWAGPGCDTVSIGAPRRRCYVRAYSDVQVVVIMTELPYCIAGHCRVYSIARQFAYTKRLTPNALHEQIASAQV